MKKINLYFIFICIALLILFLENKVYIENDNIYKEDIQNKINSFNTFAIMIEDNNGNYNPLTSDKIPSGYIFNNELSGCENGGIITWNEQKEKIIIKGNTSDKCYAYFNIKKTKGYELIKELYTSQTENNIYLHDTSLTNGALDNSYRFAGNNPDNYVCFGSDAETCPYDNLYRIIGLFGNLLKLIKADAAGEGVLGLASHGTSSKKSVYYPGKLSTIPGYYKSGTADNASNNWQNSSLNTEILNGTYLDALGTRWSEKIKMHDWQIGGNTWNKIVEVNPQEAYQNEIISSYSNILYSAKVGLMYASDYGFAASQANWETSLNSYNSDLNRENNWLFMGYYDWLLTIESDLENSSYQITSNGHIISSDVNTGTYAIRPTFYLNEDIEISKGTGMELDPYRIS